MYNRMPNEFFSPFSIRSGVYEVEYLGGGAGHAALLSGEAVLFSHSAFSYFSKPEQTFSFLSKFLQILSRALCVREPIGNTVISRTSESDLFLNRLNFFCVAR